MPTYVGLGQQGFYEPWRLLGEGLRAYQDRKMQKAQMAQQQKQHEDRLALDQAANTRAQGMFDVTLPLQSMQLQEAKREQGIRNIPALTNLAPDLQKPLLSLSPEDQQAVKSMYQAAYPDLNLSPVDIARIQSQQAVGQMPSLPQGTRMTGATFQPETGQLGNVQIAPTFDLSGGAGIPTHPGTDTPTYSWVADPSGKYVRVENPNPQTARIAAFKHVQSDPAIQNYADQASQFNLLQSSYDAITRDGASGMADVNLIYNFVKSVDPGSVVREGEITIVRSAIPALSKLGMIARRLATGEQLTPAVREQIYNAAKAAIQGSQKAAVERYNKVYRPMYGDQLPPEAEGLVQLPPSLAVTELPNTQEGLQQALQMPNGSRVSVGGKTYIRDDNSPRGIVPQ